MVRLVLIAAALASASCYQPQLVDCVYTCSETGRCPDGLSCVGGFCRAPNATATCASSADGGADSAGDAEDVNDPPENSVPAAQAASEDTVLVLSAAAGNALAISDPDAGGNGVSVTLTAQNGTLTLAGTAGLTFVAGDGIDDAMLTIVGTVATINARLDGLAFTPAADFIGSAEIAIATSDQGNSGTGGPKSDVDTVQLAVASVNDPPDAADDVPTVAEDAPATALLVLANDSSAPDAGETLTISATTQPANGTVAITGGGTGVTFQPAANFAGMTTFSYTIADGNGGSDTATVTVTVTGVNDPPGAVDDTATVAQDSAATAVAVLANDTTVESGETLTISSVTQPANGAVAITGGGTGLTFQPAATFFGATSFSYTLADGNGGTDSATVTMTVTQVCPAAPIGTGACTAGTSSPTPPYCFVVCTSTASGTTALAFSTGTWHIAKLANTAEHDAAVAIVGGGPPSWIGLKQTSATGSPSANWVWFDNSSLAITPWGGGMPNDGDNVENGQEQCGAVGAGGWGDEPCSTALSFVIEPY